MKKLFKVSVLALGLGLGFSQGASAAAYTFDPSTLAGGVDGVSYGFSHLNITAGAFSDSWAFDVAGLVDVNASALSTKTVTIKGSKTTTAGATLSSISLFDGATKIADSSFTTAVNGTSTYYDVGLDVAGLTTGHNYKLVISGSSLSAAGSYSGTVTAVSAVPEAEEWAMMIVGLGLIGVQLNRKSNKNESMSVIAA